jgi:hypothetical protein
VRERFKCGAERLEFGNVANDLNAELMGFTAYLLDRMIWLHGVSQNLDSDLRV